MRHRIGLVVPSSNTTVETEMPALLGRHEEATFSFHSSRMRMHTVSPAQLLAMNAQRERCVIELADAQVDLLLYGCLVALAVGGPGEHQRVESAIAEQLGEGGSQCLVRSSAGALIEGLQALDVHRVALVTPYLRPLAQKVVDYIDAAGFEVAAWRALEVEDNAAVGRIDGERVLAAAASMDLSGVDALVLSACVQMPSLPLIEEAEDRFGLPVLSAATAGAFSILNALNLPTELPGAGSLLSGKFATATRSDSSEGATHV